ncbi:hypothetical protein [Glycomyces paridis]|uniref:Uncharacterized protein n=1 Tax=Glycomyces paridis TaxID=2126555 RepID=A0A4S8PF05_9ACTN|nr:hypothetical protein [Glycomyces paridis]THV28441.1 hypothetical protein E9998_12640 [Glycomyces paridis]
MTAADERSALEARTVPVHHRVRELLARFPKGPLPDGEVKALGESLASKAQRPNRGPLPEGVPDRERRSLSGAARQRAFAESQAELAAIIHAAAPFAPDDLRRLGERLREATPFPGVPRALGDLDLTSDERDTIAEYLVRNGVGLTEVQVGLGLTTPAARHAEAIREVALVGMNLQGEAVTALSRLPNAAIHLYWASKRAAGSRGRWFCHVLGDLPIEAIEDLLDTLVPVETALLALDLTEHTRRPSWFPGHRRFAAALAEVARRVPDMAARRGALIRTVKALDAIRYGPCALLGFAPGEREATVARLRSALASDAALAAVREGLAADPDDAELIWLHREIETARRTDLPDFVPGFALRVTVAGPNGFDGVRLHALVDGVPVAAQRFRRGGAEEPERLLGEDTGLAAAVESHEVRLAVADCDEACCGSLRARIRRDDASGLVEWEVWNTNNPEGTLELLAFPAAAYDAEVARAQADRSWEWPARRAARVLRERLRSEPDLLTRWDDRAGWIGAWNRERSTLRVTFTHPDRPYTSTEPWLQFVKEFTVPDDVDTDDESIDAFVDGLTDRLRTTDPKTFFRVAGGSREHAEALGYTWPERR